MTFAQPLFYLHFLPLLLLPENYVPKLSGYICMLFLGSNQIKILVMSKPPLLPTQLLICFTNFVITLIIWVQIWCTGIHATYYTI